VYSHGMSVPLTILGLLEREPSYGYDLKRDYDSFFGRGKPLPFGQVYATLGRLTRDGKAAAGDIEPGEGPDRKRYVITDLGASEVETWLSEPVEPEPYLQTTLFTKVVLSIMLGKSAEHYLDRTQAQRQPGRRAPGRPWPVPSRIRPALDRCDLGAAVSPSGSGA
jgi:DNA-binding PadR family transcriptional regulator